MKKRTFSPGLMVVVPLLLLLLSGLAGCVMPSEPVNPAPKDALSYDELLANLDALEGHAVKGLALPGKTMFTLPGGTQLSTRDLSTYLGAIKKDFGGYVHASTGGSPYLVVPVKLSWSASNNGAKNSGLMWVPFTWGRRLSVPIISYQHGTQVYRYCAPSRFNPNPLAVLSNPDPTGALQAYVEGIVGALMASAGYIVVMPDYPGFGDNMDFHPYVHMSLGYSVRDIIATAGRALAGRTVTPNGKIFLTGYSEGGYATMAGARALRGKPDDSSDDIPVSAIVPCDGAYDLSGVMLKQMTSGAQVKVPSYLLYTASGYKAAGEGAIDYTTLLETDYANLLWGGLFDGSHTNAQVDAVVPSSTIPADMLTPYALSTLLAPPSAPGKPGGDVYEVLAANNGWVGWVPTAPVVMVHCPMDDVVPYQNALNALEAFSSMGLGGLVRIVDVPPVPLLDAVLGSVHVAAFPTAMLAAFTAIETVNRGY